ncbi:hypothetical protein MMC17_002928 [Xylographa soralifera]|nr:hypothetical protein [Xylographa soralifera]
MADRNGDFKPSTKHEKSATEDQFHSLKLDPHGFPLRPQPSDDPLDPLNWSRWLKFWVLFQVSCLAFIGLFSQALINSAFVPLAQSLHISVVEASYQSTVPIVFAGVSPLLWSPIANVYGRRPIFIVVTAIGVIAHAAAGAAQSWGGILAARAFVGVGTSAASGIGAAVVADLYFMHERGRYMGIFIVFLTNGAHLAAVVGGLTAKYAGWRWCYWLGAIILGGSWIVNVFCLPETLYHRDQITGQSQQPRTRSWAQLLTFRGVYITRPLYPADFLHVFAMLAYPSVLLPTLYYALSFGFGSVLFAVTGSAAFGGLYHFDTVGVGLAIGLSTFVGTLLGELLAGLVGDRLLYLYRKAHEGDPKPEARLQAIWPGFILLPVGVIIEGVCFQYRTHWASPVIGIGIGCFGLQIVSTNVYAYVTDCYKPQSAEVSTLLNFARQTFSFTIGFYAIPFAEATTYGIAWGTFAIIQAAFFTGLVALMWKGQKWRQKLGEPNFDRDL